MSLQINSLNKNAMGGTELMYKWVSERLDPEVLSQFNIIQSRVTELDTSRKNILWLHDLAHDPMSQHLRDPESVKRFDKIVFVSDWQFQQYQDVLGVKPDSRMEVIPNAIVPIEDELIVKSTQKIKLIYTSTPHRGLNILFWAFDQLCNEGFNVELDVYSSFALYGWPERDEPYREMFEAIKRHPKINYHGAVSNDEVRKAVGKSHIFAYPSIWQETSCICAIEAMSAKNILVCPNLGALPETTGRLAAMYQYREDINQHASLFLDVLRNAVLSFQNEDVRQAAQMHLDFQKNYADLTHGIHYAAKRWDSLLRGLLR